MTSTTDVTSWVSEALPFGMRLLWRVRAVDGTGEPHAWSEVFTTNTPIAVPLAPARLSAARKGLRLTLTWTAASARFFPVTSSSTLSNSLPFVDFVDLPDTALLVEAGDRFSRHVSSPRRSLRGRLLSCPVAFSIALASM